MKIYFGGSKNLALFVESKGRPGTGKFALWKWSSDERKYTRESDREVTFVTVYRGRETHITAEVKGWPAAWNAPCGRHVIGTQRTESLDKFREGMAAKTVCKNCAQTVSAIYP